MIDRFIILIKDLQKYFRYFSNKFLQRLSYFFQDKAFFLQGQMDIHHKSRWYCDKFREESGGYFPKDDKTQRKINNLEPWDNTRRDMIILLLRTILENKVDGELAELGVYKGNTAKLIHHYIPERKLHIFDTFTGFPAESAQAEQENTYLKVSATHFADTSLKMVKKNIAAQNDNVSFYQGYFPETIPEGFREKKFAFIHLDADLYKPILDGLNFFYPLLSKNGLILIHDYNAWPGARKAVDEFTKEHDVLAIPMPDKSGSALIVKK